MSTIKVLDVVSKEHQKDLEVTIRLLTTVLILATEGISRHKLLHINKLHASPVAFRPKSLDIDEFNTPRMGHSGPNRCISICWILRSNVPWFHEGELMYGLLTKKNVGASSGGIIHIVFKERGPGRT